MEKSLINAVIRRVGGRSQAIEAGNHGADAGWPGFIYYSDTCAFTARHRAEIRSMAEEMAGELGQGTVEFIKSFRCVENDTPEAAIHFALYGGRFPKELRDDVELIENALAWFALEEVGRHLSN